MKRKFLLPVAGVVAAAAIVTIISPRAVHAITAAMVQVVNTPTSAVAVVQAPAASQLYQHACGGAYFSSEVTCQFAAVPAGQTLFVETVSITSRSLKANNPVQAAFLGGLEQDTMAPAFLTVPMLQQASLGAAPVYDNFVGTVTARFPVPAGSTPSCDVQLTNPESNGYMWCQVSGYLAPAQ